MNAPKIENWVNITKFIEIINSYIDLWTNLFIRQKVCEILQFILIRELDKLIG